MASENSNLLIAACWYHSLGFRVVPIPARSKAPVLKSWQTLALEPHEFATHFPDDSNIGLLLGDPSQGLIDIDLDHPKAVELAANFLPDTGMIFGRLGKPRSHWMYRVPGGLKTRKFAAPKPFGMLFELRSTGCQTVVPPSVHPSGELIDFLEQGDPSWIDGQLLISRLEALETAVRAHLGLPPAEAKQPASTPAVPAQPFYKPQAAGNSEYAIAALQAEAEAVATAAEGTRNDTLNRAAFCIGTLIGGGEINQVEAEAVLLQAATAAGLPENEARKTMASGIKSGIEQPRSRPQTPSADHLGHIDISCFAAAASASGSAVAVLDEPAAEPAEEEIAKPHEQFPEKFLDVPGLVGEIIAYNRRNAERDQPALALLGAVGMMCALAGRKIRDERGNRTNLYLVGLANSSSGKEHARKINRIILDELNAEAIQGAEDVSSDSAIISQLVSHPVRFYMFDEFGMFLRNLSGKYTSPHMVNVVSLLMKLYTSADGVYRGKAYSDESANKTIIEPCMSLYGTTVPESFWDSLTPESMSNGFIGRLIVVEGLPVLHRTRRKVEAPPPSILEQVSWWLKKTAGDPIQNMVRPALDLVPTTPEADEIFEQLNAEAEYHMARGDNGVCSIWGRAEQKACRLALVYAASRDPKHMVIDREAAEWACGFAHWTTERVITGAESHVSETPVEKARKRIVSIIKTHIRRFKRPMGRSELVRATQWLTGNERRDAVEGPGAGRHHHRGGARHRYPSGDLLRVATYSRGR